MVASERLSCGCPRFREITRRAGAYVVNRSTYLPSCTLGSHVHAEDRIVLALRGGLTSAYNHRQFQLGAFDAIYRPAQLDHRDAYARETVCLSIRLSAGDRGHLSVFAFRDAELPGAMWRLCGELDASDSASALAIESLSALIAGRLSSSHESGLRVPRWIRQVRDRIEDEYADPPTLAAIAQWVDREVSHVANVFRRTYGKSIGEHVREVRIWRTRKLVENPAIPLAEVAQCGGFADQSHFARLFKRRFRMTPGEYRRRAAATGIARP